jgi:hypothetical protein
VTAILLSWRQLIPEAGDQSGLTSADRDAWCPGVGHGLQVLGYAVGSQFAKIDDVNFIHCVEMRSGLHVVAVGFSTGANS